MSLEGSRRVQSIVRDLKHFSRQEEEELRIPVDVRGVLEFAIDMASAEARERATIVREFRDVPQVRASESRLSQLFLNLIVNAAQAIAPGAPDQNEIRVVMGTDAQGHAVVEIRDTGEGMPTAVLQRIFEPFYTTKAPGMGTGLGLAICQRIVMSLGGQLWAESAPGRGSIFRVKLPAIDAEPR
jgi:signal transduction histidine kinase